MGDGKRLKKLLAQKKTSVMEISRECNIRPSTLYAIIRRDSSIRFDFALLLANALNVPISDICPDSSLYSNLTIETSTVDNSDYKKRIAQYYTHSLSPLIEKLVESGEHHLPELLSHYYQLTDQGRAEVIQYLEERFLLKRDSTRTFPFDN